MAITLSGGIEDWFVDKFKGDLYHVCQQQQSLLEGAVDVEPIMDAEAVRFDMMDKLEMQEKAGRNPDTPRNDVTTQQRWCFHTPYHNALQFDKDDDLEMKLDPAGAAMKALRMGRNRKVDDIILAAFDATIYAGRRNNTTTITWAGQDGNTEYTGPDTGRTIIHDSSVGNCSSSDTGMTVEKVELVLEYFRHNNVDENIPLFGLISPRQATDLFGQEEYMNIDYNDSKPFVRGRILKAWMGINWIVSTKVVLGSSNDIGSDTNVYECWFWAQDGMKLGVADSITAEMSIRDDLSYAQQVYVHMNMGAMRHDEDKIIKVECQA